MKGGMASPNKNVFTGLGGLVQIWPIGKGLQPRICPSFQREHLWVFLCRLCSRCRDKDGRKGQTSACPPEAESRG